MNITIADSYTPEEKTLIEIIVKSIFIAKGEDIETFSPSRSLFISNNSQDSADFYINASKFISDNFSYKGITLKDLGYTIFNDYVDPRDSYGVYGQLISGVEINITPKESVITPEPTPEPTQEHVIVDLKDISAGTEVDIINIPSGINIIEQN